MPMNQAASSEQQAAPIEAVNEAFDRDGQPSGSYAELFDRIEVDELIDARERICSELAAAGVVFGGEQPRPFDVDSVPRIVERDEWEGLERGLRQRVRALNAFLADVYGRRRIVDAGIVPVALIETAEWFEPAMAGADMPTVVAHVAGPDLVRGADGELRVLEDNLRAPSGLAYALAARATMEPLIERCGLEPLSLDAGIEALGVTLRDAAPGPGPSECTVLLNDGPGASALYEHRELARKLGLELAAPADLHLDGDTLMLGERAVDVIYRRVDDERLLSTDAVPTPLGELLIEPLRSGTLACVNSPGSGIADDKAIHTYVERMIGFYLDEPVLLASVPGVHLGEPGELEPALERIGELVIKPRSEFGGTGVLIGPLAEEEQIERVSELVRGDPGAYVAQEPVALSVHPTVVDRDLKSRHVDLRPFVITDPRNQDDVTVMPGGLTRFARGAGVMVVNSGQGGGAKDTWVL